MATKYWVGGSGTWDASDQTHWATSSGGAGNTSVPVDGDAVIFDASSGGGTVTLGYSPTVTSITMGAFTGTFDMATFSPVMDSFDCSGTGVRTLLMGSGTLSLRGSSMTILTFSTATNLTITGGNVNCTYSGSTGTRTISTGTVTTTGTSNIRITAGSDTISLTSGGSFRCNDLDFTGFSGSWTPLTTTLFGSLTLSSSMTIVSTSSVISMGSTETGKTITSNGKAINAPITFTGVGGSWTLQDSLNMDGASVRTLTLTNGTFNANGFNVTCGQFSSSNSNVRTLTMGTGTWTLTGTGTVWNTGTTTNLTASQASSSIVISDASASAKTFTAGGSGGAETFGNVTVSPGGSGAVTFNNSTTRTYASFNATGPKSIVLTASSAYSTPILNVTGSAGNLVTFTSTIPGTQYSFSVASGDVYARYVSLQDSNATGGARFFALNSTNVSNNTGWNFVASRTAVSNRFLIRNEDAAVTADGANGSAGRIIGVPFSASLNPTAAVTCEIWCRPTSLKAGCLFDNSTNGVTNSYTVYMGAGLDLLWFSTIGGAAKSIVTTTSRLKLNEWNLVTATYDGANVILMANGSTFATLAATGSLGTNVNALQIGAIHNGAGGLTFDGQLSRPRVYAAGCTLAEHQDRYYRGLTSTALQAALKLDLATYLGAGTSLTDLSGTGNTGTLGAGGSWTGITPFKSRKRDDGNLVKNGGFEYAPPFTAATTTITRYIDGTAGGSTTNDLFGWGIEGTNSTGTVSARFDTSNVNSGTYSMKVSTTAVASACDVRITRNISAANVLQYGIPVSPSTSYDVSFYMQTVANSGSATTGAHLRIGQYTAAGAGITSSDSTKIQTTTGLTRYTFSFTTSATTAFLIPGVRVVGNDGAGTLIMDAWFDDIVLTATTPQVRAAASGRVAIS